MPAALKTPVLEPDFAPDTPDNWNSAAAPRAASAGSARLASPARTAPRTAPRELERRQPAARLARSQPAARPSESAVEAAARARQIERKHRPFRLTITAALCGGALMGQLVLLLWLHGKTLTSARDVEKMDTQIAQVSNQIERTQERIAAFDSSPQIKHWAAEKGWSPATHQDFDDITQPAQARAQAEAAPDNARQPEVSAR